MSKKKKRDYIKVIDNNTLIIQKNCEVAYLRGKATKGKMDKLFRQNKLKI